MKTPAHQDILAALAEAERSIVEARGTDPEKVGYQNCKLALGLLQTCRESIEPLTDSPHDTSAARIMLERAHVSLGLMQSGEAAGSVKIARALIENLLDGMPTGGVLP